MSLIYGKSTQEVSNRIGSLAQLAKIDASVFSNGVSAGSRTLRIVTGGKLEIEVLPDRALDLGQVTFAGVPMAWISSAGFTSPDAYDPEGINWLKTFGGGMLTTCGLDSFGPPSKDQEKQYGLHGSITAQRADINATSVSESGEILVSGTIRQAHLFGENLSLTRNISSTVGSSSFSVSDTVTNNSRHSAGHMVLYHCNIGWPLIDEDARISIPSSSFTPRDEASIAGVKNHLKIQEPEDGYVEQVFIHDFHSAEPKIEITNKSLGIKLEIEFSSKTLPYLLQWRLMSTEGYVLGIEPANTPEHRGRAAARESGRLPMLQPGESVDYTLTFTFQQIEKDKKA